MRVLRRRGRSGASGIFAPAAAPRTRRRAFRNRSHRVRVCEPRAYEKVCAERRAIASRRCCIKKKKEKKTTDRSRSMRSRCCQDTRSTYIIVIRTKSSYARTRTRLARSHRLSFGVSFFFFPSNICLFLRFYCFPPPPPPRRPTSTPRRALPSRHLRRPPLAARRRSARSLRQKPT